MCITVLQQGFNLMPAPLSAVYSTVHARGHHTVMVVAGSGEAVKIDGWNALKLEHYCLGAHKASDLSSDVVQVIRQAHCVKPGAVQFIGFFVSVLSGSGGDQPPALFYVCHNIFNLFIVKNSFQGAQTDTVMRGCKVQETAAFRGLPDGCSPCRQVRRRSAL